MDNDPLATLKLMAATYGIPPEVTEKIFGAGAAVVNSALDRARSTEIVNLLRGAEAATAIGQVEIADALIEEVREIMGLSEGEGEAQATAGEVPQA